MSMSKPSSGDTEEDLLRFQRDFLASGSRSAVKVVKKRRGENPISPSQGSGDASETSGAANRDVIEMDLDEAPEIPKRVKFHSEQGESEISAAEDIEKEMDARDTHITTVLNKITERDTTGAPVLFPSLRTNAFPTVFQRVNKSKSSENAPAATGKSLFAQQFSKKALNEYGALPSTAMPELQKSVKLCALSPLPSTVPTEHLRQLYPASSIISGRGLLPISTESNAVEKAASIHEENLQRLCAMSEAEVLAEKHKLLSGLDPKLVSFLQSRSKRSTMSKEERFLGDLSKQTEIKKVEEVMETEVSESSKVTKIPMEGKYLHMDVVEPEKLAWTEMIPKKQRTESTLSHRFDFDGNILPSGADIPSHIGLHHHGEDPDLPGYTLQELFTLSRSNFKQQRVFAVTLLGKICAKAKLGEYLGVATVPILDDLLQTGLLFLLRWSLDEQSETLLQASVFALHSLLCSPQAETALEFAYFSDRGCEFPSLSPNVKLKDDDSDFDIAQKDIITGLLKMKLLPRVRYILEVCRPGIVTVNHCLEILTRLARHSMQSAVAVYECPRLLGFIMENLIPMSPVSGSHDAAAQKRAYATPFPKAIALLRAICTAGRHVTSRLLRDYKDAIKTVLFKYVGGSQEEVVHVTVVSDAGLEVWKLWISCCSYGFFCSLFRELFPVITGHIQSFTARSSEPGCDRNALLSDAKRTKLVFKLCTTVFRATAPAGSRLSEWKEIGDQMELVAKIVAEKFIDGCNDDEIRSELKILLSLFLEFVSAFCERLAEKSDWDITSIASYSERMRSRIVSSLFDCLRKMSFSEGIQVREAEQISSLPELAVLSDPNCLPDFHYLSSYLHSCVAICKLNKNICESFHPVVDHMAVNCEWMISDAEHLSSFLLRSRTYCLYWSVELYSLLITSSKRENITQNGGFCFTVAFQCFGMLGNGDEHLMHRILSSVLFHPDVLRAAVASTGTVTDKMASLGVSRNVSEMAPDSVSVTNSALSSLPSIRATYLSSLAIDNKVLLESKLRYLHRNEEISSFLLRHGAGSARAPSDWAFIPLLQIYDRSISGELPGGSLTHVSNCLHYLCLLERHCKGALSSVSTVAKILRLMCTFLAGNDIFLEPPVKHCLSFLFSHYCDVSSREVLDFSRPIPGISSFYDFYLSLLEQYEGVSYGDDLFSAVVLLPLHQLNGGIPDIKRAIWSERRHLLRILALPISKLLFPASWYLYPVEKDSFMIRSYVSALATGYCTPLRCPVLYLMAVHHTAGFLFDKGLDVSAVQRKEIYRGVTKIRQDAIRKHVLHYVGPDDDLRSTSGFKFEEHVTESRKKDIAFLGQ